MSNSCNVKYFYILFLSVIISTSFLSGSILFAQEADSTVNGTRTLKAEEIIRGERLFYGLVYKDKKSVNCAGCHNTVYSDSLNWNPRCP